MGGPGYGRRCSGWWLGRGTVGQAEKAAGPGVPVLRRVPVCQPSAAEICRTDNGGVGGLEEGATEKMLL